MKNIVIIGSGGFAKEVAFLIDEINKVNKIWNILGYIDSDIGKYNGKYSVFQNDEWLITTKKPINVAFGIGSPILLKNLSDKFIKNKNLCFPNIIHHNVIADWEKIDIGRGNIICSSNIFTTDIKIGSFNVFNLNTTLGHDSCIGNYNIINPSVNLSGGVDIGHFNLIGTSATILQYVKINNEIIIGANSLVNKNIVEKGVYVGAPCKKIK
ncbi:MAG: transferase [Flavobacteriales bacterium]|nr:transferase [Flavobacteriales bacterium]|tara:strand:- start:9422 stop:10054 length:633 start_codon:yes stop_codon:yes gene_type:complete